MTTDEANLLITTVLTTLGYNTPAFVNLLLGTCAQESALGKYEVQEGSGIAKGIMMCENATFQDINKNFLSYHKALNTLVQSYAPTNAIGTANDLVNNHEYAVAYSACSFIRHHVPSVTVDPNDIPTMFSLYKMYYNSASGAATQAEFTKNWHFFGISN